MFGSKPFTSYLSRVFEKNVRFDQKKKVSSKLIKGKTWFGSFPLPISIWVCLVHEFQIMYSEKFFVVLKLPSR